MNRVLQLFSRSFGAALTLTAVACGGGSSTQLASCGSELARLCDGLNTGSTTTIPPATTSSVQLFTTAPTSVTLAAGGSATYTIGGGTALYTATSGNTGVVTASVSGNSLTVSAFAAGTAPVVVVDAVGKQVAIAVTVLSREALAIPLSVFPGSITVSDCTTNIPFVFTGGTAPYTVYSSDNQGVPVSSPLPLGADSYFMASVKNPQLIGPPYIATLTVLDGQSRTAITRVTIGSSLVCSPNTLQQVSPGSTNARESEILTFTISGGLGPYTVQTTNPPSSPSTPLITTATMTGATTFDVRANAVGTSLITVTGSDQQKTNIVFTVLPRLPLP